MAEQSFKLVDLQTTVGKHDIVLDNISDKTDNLEFNVKEIQNDLSNLKTSLAVNKNSIDDIKLSVKENKDSLILVQSKLNELNTAFISFSTKLSVLIAILGVVAIPIVGIAVKLLLGE